MIKSKKIFLYWKQINFPYAIQNKDHFSQDFRVIGSSISAANKMIASSEEQKILMPEILGVSPTSSNWDTMLAHYWNSLSEDIPSGGKELEIGYEFDITSVAKKPYIDAHNKGLSDKDKITTDEQIVEYFEKEYNKIISKFKETVDKANKLGVSESTEKIIDNAYRTKYDNIEALEKQKYKFGTPINVSDYILYRYCLNYAQVANEYALVNKSNNIRFYLHSEDEIKAQKEAQRNLEKDRMTTFLEVIKSPDKVENILYAFGLGVEVSKMDASDKDVKLNQVSMDNPTRFIRLANDKNIQTIGLIEKYILKGVLRRLENTNIIVDTIDPSIIIGNSMTEAVSYFSNEENKKVISEFEARFKGSPNIK